MNLYESTVKTLSCPTTSEKMAALLDLIDQGHGAARLAIMHQAIHSVKRCYLLDKSTYEALEAFIEAHAQHNLDNSDNDTFNDLISIDTDTDNPDVTFYEKTVCAIVQGCGMADSPMYLLPVFNMAQNADQVNEICRALTDLGEIGGFDRQLFHLATSFIRALACKKFPDTDPADFYKA